jgi:hypothetical protein
MNAILNGLIGGLLLGLTAVGGFGVAASAKAISEAIELSRMWSAAIFVFAMATYFGFLVGVCAYLTEDVK